MMKTLFLIISSLLPGILLAQPGSDEAYKVCEGKVFARVETLPDYKKGKAAFEDTLTGYLKKKNALPKSGNITYTFIVTMQSKLFDLRKVEGDVKYEDSVKTALISIPVVWIPANQNSHPVCAYVGLTIAFSKNTLTAKIVEPASIQPDF